MMIRTGCTLLIAIAIVCASTLNADQKQKKDKKPVETKRVKIVDGSWEIPTTWKKAKRRPLREAEYELPGQKGEKKKPVLIFYYFGEGSGGGVEPNLKRWEGQFEDLTKKPKVEEMTVDGVKITTLSLIGSFKDKPSPFAENFELRTDYRMLNAVIETKEGPLYLRFVGSNKSVTAHFDAWKKMLKSTKQQ